MGSRTNVIKTAHEYVIFDNQIVLAVEYKYENSVPRVAGSKI